MERQVPGREPRVLPRVRHRHDVAGDHVEPRHVADVRRVRVPRVDAVLAQPAVDVVLVVLLGPQQAGQRLAHHQRPVGVERRRDHLRVELVGLLAAGGEHGVEVGRVRARGQPHPHLGRAARGDLEHVVRGALRAARRVDRRAVDHVVVDRRLRAGLVLAVEQRRVGLEAPLPELGVAGDAVGDRRLLGAVAATCCETTAWGARAAVAGSGPRLCTVTNISDVVRRGLGVLDDHVEVAVVVEDPGVEQLVLEVVAAAAAVLGDQVRVRERPLRILVEALQVRVRGRAVEVEPVLLGVLAVVALAVGEPEDPLLEDRVGAVPQRERQAQPLALVADAGDAVLAPAVGARARLVVREVVPGVAVRRCSPRGPCPTGARTGTGPTPSTGKRRCALPPVACVPGSPP